LPGANQNFTPFGGAFFAPRFVVTNPGADGAFATLEHMPTPPDWIEHRRGDRELLGWMRPDGDGFVVIDLLGREVTGVVDWQTAEETLDALGIGYLADSFELRLDEASHEDEADPAHNPRWLRVRITEVSTDAIRVKKEDWGAMDAPAINYSVPFPVGGKLRTP
jgi:hypothetical protein